MLLFIKYQNSAVGHWFTYGYLMLVSNHTVTDVNCGFGGAVGVYRDSVGFLAVIAQRLPLLLRYFIAADNQVSRVILTLQLIKNVIHE